MANVNFNDAVKIFINKNNFKEEDFEFFKELFRDTFTYSYNRFDMDDLIEEFEDKTKNCYIIDEKHPLFKEIKNNFKTYLKNLNYYSRMDDCDQRIAGSNESMTKFLIRKI